MAVKRRKRTSDRKRPDDMDTPLEHLAVDPNAKDAVYAGLPVRIGLRAFNRRNKHGRRPALVIWDLPRALRTKFRECCEDHGVAMKDVIYLLLTSWVAGRIPAELLQPQSEEEDVKNARLKDAQDDD